MSPARKELAAYRPGIGIMLLNNEGFVFIGHRIHMPQGLAAWQMPQGGINAGETPGQTVWRELKEEIGTEQAEILGESRGWFYHEVPNEISQHMMGGKYCGNRQKWFAMRFTGADSDINIATDHPEFDSWKWLRPERLPELIVPFMKQLYLDVLVEFDALWSAAARVRRG
jgi:putative (di)nucleoside polyphosphate hydrolase